MSTITLNQINNHKIRPVKIKQDPRPIKGADIFPDLYCTMFAVAYTDGGKTTMIHNIVPKIIGKHTKVIIFASTVYSDDLWIDLRKKLEKKDIEVEVHDSLKDHEGNHLENLVKDLVAEAKEREELEGMKDEEEEPKPTTDDILNAMRRANGLEDYINQDDDEGTKPRKSKYQSPEYLIIMDDLSDELRSPYIATLLKKSRHFHIRLIISSQYLKDLMPSSRLQVKSWALFRGMPDSLLEDLHRSLGMKLPLEVFAALYKKSTEISKDHSKHFLYFMQRRNEYRRDFTHKWIIPHQLFE